MTTLYSLRTYIGIDKEGYTITKFIDGEVESTYFLTRDLCECPAGVRPTCRHRQMLPHMLNEGIVNTHYFLNWDDGRRVVDFEGTDRRVVEQVAPRQTFEIPDGYEAILDNDGRATGEVRPIQPHSTTVSAPDFDSGDGGSNPPAVATPQPFRRRL